MTIKQVLDEVRTVKACSESQLRRHFHALGIEPLGVRQVPQQWPAEAGAKVINYLGLNGHNGKIVSINRLKKVRTAAKVGRGK